MSAELPAPGQNKTWRQRLVLILTLILVVLLMMRPELRIFLPLLDALGLELLLAIMASQVIDFVRPGFHLFVRYIVGPSAAKLYAQVLFLFGVTGPYMGAWASSFIASQWPVAKAAP